MDLTAAQVALLCGAALCAGTIDAIAGGGGLVSLPALLAVGLPPHEALGTNKGQSVFGSFAATLRYRHAGLLDGATTRVAFPIGFLGSVVGAVLALWIRPDVLRPIVLALLVVVAGIIASGRLRPREGMATTQGYLGAVAVMAVVLGAYDGFFGPGAGTFMLAAYVAFAHRPLRYAAANGRVLNFATNLAAMLMFAREGRVLWAVSLPMAACQLLGGFLGAHLAIRRGEGLIRGVLLVVVIAIVIWLVNDIHSHPVGR
ncbi:MAG TPA: TSUP family transporter [Candidatus Eisenbacteria bacterium]|nr:TSUP family transporter [Candidatus Eisenbacteria bacterium]